MTLRWVPGWNGLTEPEAVSYVAAVEAADNQELEFGVARAINDFVVGCKADGIWDAIKASCILAGARTLTGALVPLVGAAPTNYNFVAGDYNRKTGLVGDGSTKYLDSNRAGNADPLDSFHLIYFASSVSSGPANYYIGTGLYSHIRTGFARNRNNLVDSPFNHSTGFNGISRGSSAYYTTRASGTNKVEPIASVAAVVTNTHVFKRADSTGQFVNARLSFYSIGESLDLALLDTRVSNLMTAIGAAIP